MLINDLDRELVDKVLHALQITYSTDYFLIENGCHELSIVAAFYHCFKNEYEAWFKSAYPEVSIDMEYSKMGEKMCAKLAPPNESGKKHIRIDFVIHKRQSQTQNLLAIEFKLDDRDKDIKWDYEKLRAITVKCDEANQVRNYELGISILLKKDYVEMKYFKDGNDIEQDESFKWLKGKFCKMESIDIVTSHIGRVNQRRSYVRKG